MGILKTLLSLPHLADDLESEEYASAKLFGKIADLEKKIEKPESRGRSPKKNLKKSLRQMNFTDASGTGTRNIKQQNANRVIAICLVTLS